MNPVIYFDELDKISDTPKGEEITGILTYLTDTILKDRMYRIQTKGYDAKEKLVIARKYMLPKIREQVNFSEEDVVISDEVIQYIISNETWTQQEQGVRNMKR